MRRKYARNYLSLKLHLPQIIIITIFFVGNILGVFFANTLQGSEATDIAKLIEGFIINMDANEVSNIYLLRQSILTHGKTILFVWLFGLSALALPLTALLVWIQGFSYGFTTSFFIMKYNLKGLLLCLCAYGVQGTIFVCLLFVISMESIRFARRDNRVSFKTYLLYLLLSIILVIILGLFEAYVSPIIIKYIITVLF